MDQQGLSSRAIMGMYFARLEQNPGLAWVNGVSNLFGSDQDSETYKFLGMSPVMRQWIAGRQAKGFRENGVTIQNKHYEATIEIETRDARRDKTGQIMARINEFADRSQSHWASLLSTLILAADATTCYDGQYFFATGHTEGSSGSQSNKLTKTIANYPCTLHGTTTVPSVEEMRFLIIDGIVAILGFKDDQGEPMNEEAQQFLVKVPPAWYLIALAAVSTGLGTAPGAVQNLDPNLFSQMKISVQMNPRLTWTNKLAVFRTDSPIKALIRQSETEVELKAKAEGSEFEFDNDAWQFGIDAWRNVGLGYWQRACQVIAA